MQRISQRRRFAALRAHPLLASCSRDELRLLDSLGAVVQRPAGQLLLTQGMIGRECFVVLDGSVAIARNGEVLTVLGAGSLVGELSLLSGEPRNATVMAVTDVALLVLSPREFGQLLTIPPIRAAVLARADERAADRA